MRSRDGNGAVLLRISLFFFFFPFRSPHPVPAPPPGLLYLLPPKTASALARSRNSSRGASVERDSASRASGSPAISRRESSPAVAAAALRRKRATSVQGVTRTPEEAPSTLDVPPRTGAEV